MLTAFARPVYIDLKLEVVLYSSLDKIDILAEEDGEPIAVQTDHRQPEEIGEEMALSLIFAAARIQNPRRQGTARVRMVFFAAPPPAYQAFLLASGAEVEVAMNGEKRAPQPDDALVDGQINGALAQLGAQVFARHGATIDEAGMQSLQQIYARRVAGVQGNEDEEIVRWSAVAELGAAMGLLLMNRYSARWVRDPQFYSMIPYLISVGDNMLNVFSKVERFFTEGVEEAPLQLLKLAADMSTQADGPVMFNLRPADWPHQNTYRCRPLMENAEKMPVHDIPLIALVRDRPNTTASFPANLAPDTLTRLEAEAMDNLKKLEVVIQDADIGLPLKVIHGDYYATEKLLDVDFLRALQRGMAAKMLLAGAPVKGQLFVYAAEFDPQKDAAFARFINVQYDQAPGPQKLSSEVFIVTDGEVSGVVRPSTDDGALVPPPTADGRAQKKGIWSRTFGW